MQPIKIVCLGDSTTYGFPYGPEYSWTSMLAEQINGQVINKGINGNATEDMLMRFKKDVLDLKPDYVIITGGINDVVQGESLARITLNIENMIEKACEEGIKVILGLPTPVDYPPWESVLKKLRIYLAEFAQKNNLSLIDFCKAFYTDEYKLKKELLLPDGGHPTREGYMEMFKQIDIGLFK